MIVAAKDGTADSRGDALLTNSYLGAYVHGTPDYWEKLIDMLYGEGRLRKFTSIVEDIVEKFSFLMLAKDQIAERERTLDARKRFFVKYFIYTYIFMTKSFLDALAVFINESYALGFNGGNVDFKKGRFMAALKDKNKMLATRLMEKQDWINLVVKYRDNLIHKHGLYVGPIPTVPEGITDPREVDLYILREPHYIPNDPDLLVDHIYEGIEGEFIQVSVFADEWIQQSFGVFDLVLGSFAASFEALPPEEIFS